MGLAEIDNFLVSETPRAGGLAAIDDFLEQRFKDMLNIQKYCLHNGFPLVRIYLHLSKKEQKKF